MKKLIVALLILPFFAFGDTYQDAAGTSQMIADSFGDLWGFFFDDVPSLIDRFVAFVLLWLVKAKLYLQIETIKAAAPIAKVMIQDLNIISQITSQMTALPQDVRQALVDMRLFDGVNIIIHAYFTRFVMDFFK